MDTTLNSRSDAAHKIKTAPVGTEFFLRIRNDAPIVSSADVMIRSGLSSYVRVSRKEALRLVDSMLSESLENKGGRMPIDIDGKRFWFGA